LDRAGPTCVCSADTAVTISDSAAALSLYSRAQPGVGAVLQKYWRRRQWSCGRAGGRKWGGVEEGIAEGMLCAVSRGRCGVYACGGASSSDDVLPQAAIPSMELPIVRERSRKRGREGWKGCPPMTARTRTQTSALEAVKRPAVLKLCEGRCGACDVRCAVAGREGVIGSRGKGSGRGSKSTFTGNGKCPTFKTKESRLVFSERDGASEHDQTRAPRALPRLIVPLGVVVHGDPRVGFATYVFAVSEKVKRMYRQALRFLNARGNGDTVVWRVIASPALLSLRPIMECQLCTVHARR
jgi:hypothetical protein